MSKKCEKCSTISGLILNLIKLGNYLNKKISSYMGRLIIQDARVLFVRTVDHISIFKNNKINIIITILII